MLVQVKLHYVIIPESKLARCLVAQSDQLLQVLLHQTAHGLAGFPHRFSLRRVPGFLQDFAHLAVGHLFVIHFRPEDVEGLLDGVCPGGDLPQEGRLDLLFEVHEIEHVDLARQQAVAEVAFFDFLEFRKSFLACQRLVQSVLRFFLGFEVLVLPGHIRVPPGQIDLFFQRPDPGLVFGNEFSGASGVISRLRHAGRSRDGRDDGEQNQGTENPGHGVQESRSVSKV